MKQKNDQPDHIDHKMRSANEIERSEKRSHRDQNYEKFSTTTAKNAGVTTAKNAGVNEGTTAKNAGVNEKTTAKNAGVDKRTTAKNAGVKLKNFTLIPDNLLDKILSEIDKYSAAKVYLYMYRKAYKWTYDDSEKAVCNAPISEIMAACNMAERVVIYALQYLEENGWIEIEKCPGRENIYTVKRPKPETASDGDHDLSYKNHDLYQEDHHDPAEAEDDDSLLIVKQVYVELTKNPWTSKDTESYKNLPNNLQTEDTIRYMRAINGRIKKPIGSFAYFVKAINRELESPKNKTTTISKLRKIIERVREANIGSKVLSTTDFREQVKDIAARDSVPYTPDFLEQAFKLVT